MMMIPLLSLLRGPEVEMEVHFEVNMKIKRDKRPQRQSFIRDLLGLDGSPVGYPTSKKALETKSPTVKSRSKTKGRYNIASETSSSKDHSTHKRGSSYRQKISKTPHRKY